MDLLSNSEQAATATSNLSSLLTSLDEVPKEKWWRHMSDLYQYEGFWYLPPHLAAGISARSHFEAREEDIILASSIKTGTTWLKAIIPTIFSIGNEDGEEEDPLLHNHPNELMPSLELQLFKGSSNLECLSGAAGTVPSSPRLFRTHLPYQMLPESVKTSGCKIVYITRDPKDVFVSSYYFFNQIAKTSERGLDGHMDEMFESFCKGVYPFGPFHDHVLGYWNETLERPHKFLFLRYEELKSDPSGQIRKLASFIGKPFLKDEQVEEVLRRCSLERVKNLEVNKNGVDPWIGIPKNAYFRLGVVGDWKNHFTKEMQEQISEITRSKMEGSGLNIESS